MYDLGNARNNVEGAILRRNDVSKYYIGLGLVLEQLGGKAAAEKNYEKARSLEIESK